MSKNIRRDDWSTLRPTFFGWGINDVNYKVEVRKEGLKNNSKRLRKRVWVCPYYLDWVCMLQRCLCPIYHKEHPTYRNCAIYPEWQYLSNFIEWVDNQPNRDWEKCALDKDFLLKENKYYAPEVCVYIPRGLNTFIVDKGNGRGGYMIGVSFIQGSKINPYRAACNNPFTKSWEHLGLFPTELEAHKAWQAKKHEHALKLATMQSDIRVVKRLEEMYSPDKDLTYK